MGEEMGRDVAIGMLRRLSVVGIDTGALTHRKDASYV